MSSSDDRKPGFSPLGELIKKKITELAKNRAPATVDAYEFWPQIIGEALAPQSRIIMVKDNVLHIGVQHPGLITELTFKKGQILAAFKDRGHSIIDIKFKVVALS